MENGHDVRFSIDDLRAKTKPEGWDGESTPYLRWQHFVVQLLPMVILLPSPVLMSGFAMNCRYSKLLW